MGVGPEMDGAGNTCATGVGFWCNCLRSLAMRCSRVVPCLSSNSSRACTQIFAPSDSHRSSCKGHAA